ncbi:hypothetical protein OKW50_007471 [Paraburkholderia youngii]|uniref:hypothetical protein n=1 Tax=Paraburkholderia TaxID=1822464 RepID=UPI0015937AFD|nr:hypothetical protein [Paraburkholderia youngii]
MADKRASRIGRVPEWTSRSSELCMAQASGGKWPYAEIRGMRTVTADTADAGFP